MYLQNFLPALQIRQLYRHTAVEASRPGERGIEGFRTVGGGQKDDAAVFLKSVHFRQKLVQRLFPLIIAAEAAVAFLADGVDFIDKDDAGSLFLGLFEKVAHFCGSHTHKHLDEFRSGHGKERNVGFTGYRLCEHGFSGARRTDQQDAFWHGGSDFSVFIGIMKIIHDFLKVFFGLFFSGDIVKFDTFRRFDVDFGIALSYAESQGIRPSGFLHQLFRHILSESDENDDRQDPGEEKTHQRRHLLDDLAVKLCAGIIETLCQIRIIHHTCLVDFRIVAVCEKNLVVLRLDFHLTDIFVVRHSDELTVVNFLDLTLSEPGHGQEIEQQQNEQYDDVIKDQRSLRAFYFMHLSFLLSSGSVSDFRTADSSHLICCMSAESL